MLLLDQKTYTVNAVTPAVYTKADGTKVVKRPDGTFTTNVMVLLVMMFLQVMLSYPSKMQQAIQLVVTPLLIMLALLLKIKQAQIT